ncbi:HAMP domain-containing histidine kinase [Photobacterium japonica]|uniref:sensor histidine kinase n=1 Tax=Photobacterium japonica TaxID=2910235 RepID=UPI003D10B94B
MDKATALKHNHFPSIYRKIRWSFGIMTFAMFSLFWSVIYIAENQLEIISLHHWLDAEAERFVDEYRVHKENTPLPNSDEFSSYWSEGKMPSWLHAYNKPGFYEHLLGEEDKHFIAFRHPSGKGLMYVLFQDDADDYLDGYEDSLHSFTFLFGILVSLGMAMYGIYFVRTISKPLGLIEAKVAQMPPDQPYFKVETAYNETRKIEQTLLDSKSNIASFFLREKEFSRFASHELRTPIMVIQGSAELLNKVPNQPAVALKAIDRVGKASEEMRVLTETFLLLGKESVEVHHLGEHDLEQKLRQQLDALAPLFAKQDASYALRVVSSKVIVAPESFITIIINNLIKNAFSYSVGDIYIQLAYHTLTIINRHEGNETYHAGYGCGLVIVERICERMGWFFTTNDDGQQFKTTVSFSNADSLTH